MNVCSNCPVFGVTTAPSAKHLTLMSSVTLTSNLDAPATGNQNSVGVRGHGRVSRGASILESGYTPARVTGRAWRSMFCFPGNVRIATVMGVIEIGRSYRNGDALGRAVWSEVLRTGGQCMMDVYQEFRIKYNLHSYQSQDYASHIGMPFAVMPDHSNQGVIGYERSRQTIPGPCIGEEEVRRPGTLG